MHIDKININNSKISFGTKFGPKIAKLVDENYNKMSSTQKKVIDKVKNDGFDDLYLELKGNNHYVELDGDILDTAKSINTDPSFFHWNCFKNLALIKYCKKFPIYIKPFTEILEIFNDKNLPTKILEERKFAENVVSEYSNFTKYNNELKKAANDKKLIVVTDSNGYV